METVDLSRLSSAGERDDEEEWDRGEEDGGFWDNDCGHLPKSWLSLFVMGAM